MRFIPLPFSHKGREGAVVINAPAGAIGFDGFLASITTELADYFVSQATGDDNANGQTPGTAWKTIGKVNNPTPVVFGPGDTIAFERGGVYGDTELRPVIAGTAGNPITFEAYGVGANKPELGSVNNRRIVIVEVDHITVKDLHFRKTDGAAAAKGLVSVNARNFTWKDCDLTGEVAGNSGISGLRFDDGGEDFLVDGGTVTDVHSGGISMAGGSTSGTIRNIFFGTHAQAGASGDNCGSEADTVGGPWFIENCIFDSTADLTRGEQNFDNKGEGTWTITNCIFFGARQGSIINQHGTVTIYNTCVFFGNSNSAREVTIGIERTPSLGEPIVTFNFCTFVPQTNNYTDFVRLNDPVAVTFNSCAFIVPAGITCQRLIEMRVGLVGGGVVKLFNCTLVNRGTLIELLNVRDTWDGTVEIANSIFDSNAADLLLDFNGNNNNITLNQNLYFRPAGGNWARHNGINYTEAGLINTLDTSGSDTGDPKFASVDPDNANFFLPNVGSPALDLGDPNKAPTLDLVGIAYDTVTPNSGCREGVA